ncbi:hypothetical protein RhiirA4_470932, partial [Rhizophagus irregularis]
LPPYHDIAHDKILAISICQGLRPKSNYKIPQLILDIIKQCWDADPLKRPKAQELFKLVDNLYDELYGDSDDDDSDDGEINKQVKEAKRINKKFTSTSLPYNGTTLSYTTNPQAVYTSRLLDFKNLPEPKNAIDNKADVVEYSESIEAIDFTNLNLGTHLYQLAFCMDRVGNSSSGKRIDEAKFQIDKLLEDIEITKEIELDINISSDQRHNKGYVTKEFDLDINAL